MISRSGFSWPLTFLAWIALLGFAGTATAATVTNDRPLIFAFDGADTSIGGFDSPGAAAADEETGALYVINLAGAIGKGPTGYGPGPTEWDDERVVCKFDAEGTAENYAAGSSAGKSCLDGKDTPGKAFGVEGFFAEPNLTADVAVDNSGSEGQGRLYVSELGGPVHAFAKGGSYRWTLKEVEIEGKTTQIAACGIAVDAEGYLWVGNGNGGGNAQFEALKFDASGGGTPTKPIDSIPMTHGNKRPCRLAIDKSGDTLYAGLAPTMPLELDKYVKGKYDSTLASGFHFDVAVDQSKTDGHIFYVGSTSFGGADFEEYAPCGAVGCPGTKVAGSPFGDTGAVLGSGVGIAHNPTLDWIYIPDGASRTVKVFGPVASGTAPDVSCQATDEIGLHEATAHCTINPLSLPHEYRFEWKEGTGSNWAGAESSPPQSIEPTDSNPHEVSFSLTEYKGKALKSNTDYQVRLVGTNAEPDKLLDAYSNTDSFKTPAPPPPEIEDCSISEVATDSAHVKCTIDPQVEETTWRVEKSIDPACAKGFSPDPQQTIPAGEPGAVEVDWDLEGLLPAQHYCVRVAATNNAGTTTTTSAGFLGEEDELKTLAIPPSEAAAAFAAPRTDTTARINARVNPEGEADLKYRFELSDDEGETWTLLPERESTIDVREPIVLAEELTGLEPGSTYRYRLAVTENEAGPAASLGGERAFGTRTSEEMTLPPNAFPGEPDKRGIELVNSPDKGNQNVFYEAPTGGAAAATISPDGEKALWLVVGGAPGGPNGTQSNFLAERGKAGWESRSLAPPAGQQFGGSELSYILYGANADLDAFAFAVRLSTGFGSPPPPTVARVRGGEHDVLKSYEGQPPNPTWEASLELSDDGEHVLFIDAETKQLEDIGAARVGPPEIGGEVASLMPGGGPSQCGLDPYVGKSFGNAGNTMGQPGYRWIAAADASRVYFLVPADGDCGGPYRLWVRNRDAETTTEIDGKSPTFLRATPDGRAAYFLTKGKLDPADTDSGADVYRWEEQAGKSSCLTCVAGGDAQVAETSVMVSDDFSHVYFTSEEQLAPPGRVGAFNLYVLSGGEIRFVGLGEKSTLDKGLKPGLSADGNVLLFRALPSPALTADPMAAQCPAPCTQLYRYDDRDESLECISCRHGAATTHRVGSPGRPLTSYRLSGDGTTVGFVTQAALLGADVNQDTDIYEWREGARRLISDGVSDFQEEFSAPQVTAVDEDGSDIFFMLVPPGGSLTGFEQDGVLNLYDARIGGGFEPPSPPAHCIEDSCQGPLRDAPALERGPSASFEGGGNLEERTKPKRPCAKKRGKAKRRCIANQRRRAASAKQRRTR